MGLKSLTWRFLYLAVISSNTLPSLATSTGARIDRHHVVTHFNLVRTSASLQPPAAGSNSTAKELFTPVQIGNSGKFAFTADLTSLQTFQSFSTLSSWAWKNDSLPSNRTFDDIWVNYQGARWPEHDRIVEYDFAPDDGDKIAEQYLISNPNRVNLGRVGLLWVGSHGVVNVTQEDIEDVRQELDLWTGLLKSCFNWNNQDVTVQVAAAQSELNTGSRSSVRTGTIAIKLTSPLLQTPPQRPSASGANATTTNNRDNVQMGLFLDHPWADGSAKFSAPYVGYWDQPSLHTTSLQVDGDSHGHDNDSPVFRAQITHQLVNSTFFTTVVSKTLFHITRDSKSLHRYSILPAIDSRGRRNAGNAEFDLTVTYSSKPIFPSLETRNSGPAPLPSQLSVLETPDEIFKESTSAWNDYWSNSGFLDVQTGSQDPRAKELQRRIILSRYYVRINAAGENPPQESGLVNNGWYGKFHMEMYWWHTQHFSLWSNQDLVSDTHLRTYTSFLPSSIQRARVQQNYPKGARWPKMTDPTGRSTPGLINNLLIWQQPHPIVFAEYEYRNAVASGSRNNDHELQNILTKWKPIIRETADWMATYAWFNESSSVYDLGPPLQIVSEDGQPNSTFNPAFELAYWRLTLGMAINWYERLNDGDSVPSEWRDVKKGLAKLPTSMTTTANEGEQELYAVYEGIEPEFWTTPASINDHPAMVGLYGWLPPTEGLDVEMIGRTAEKTWTHWNLTNCWGWDFPMLAMNAARLNNTQKAIEFLLDPLYQFDDVGMPVGGVRVPTPYFPASGSLLYAVAMMAAGWDGLDERVHAPGFPKQGWNVRYEDLRRAL